MSLNRKVFAPLCKYPNGGEWKQNADGIWTQDVDKYPHGGKKHGKGKRRRDRKLKKSFINKYDETDLKKTTPRSTTFDELNKNDPRRKAYEEQLKEYTNENDNYLDAKEREDYILRPENFPYLSTEINKKSYSIPRFNRYVSSFEESQGLGDQVEQYFRDRGVSMHGLRNFPVTRKDYKFSLERPDESWNKYVPIKYLESGKIYDDFFSRWYSQDYNRGKWKKPWTSLIEDELDYDYIKSVYPNITDEDIKNSVEMSRNNPTYITNNYNSKWGWYEDLDNEDFSPLGPGGTNPDTYIPRKEDYTGSGEFDDKRYTQGYKPDTYRTEFAGVTDVYPIYAKPTAPDNSVIVQDDLYSKAKFWDAKTNSWIEAVVPADYPGVKNTKEREAWAKQNKTFPPPQKFEPFSQGGEWKQNADGIWTLT